MRHLAAAIILLASAPASAQWLWDSFDSYDASSAGVPLGGQGDWTTPAGAADWNVYTLDSNPFGLTQPSDSKQFAAGVGPGLVGGEPGVALALHPMMVGPNYVRILARVAIIYTGRPPSEEEIGRITIEPLGTSASAALVARWTDPAVPEAWNADLLWYDSAGVERITQVPSPDFQSLRPGVWHEWSIDVRLNDNTIDDVQLRPIDARWPSRASSSDWYLAGGAAGGLPPPSAVSMRAGAPGAPGAVLAVDLIEDLAGCFVDCDQNGWIDFFDFLCFQTRFAVGDPYADCDGSGLLDWFDFLCYQNEFALGECGP